MKSDKLFCLSAFIGGQIRFPQPKEAPAHMPAVTG
jgi:hypothetical protein